MFLLCIYLYIFSITDVSVYLFFSLTLIVVTQDDQANDVHLRCLLDYIFHSMVLVYGLDDLMNIKNVERFKRDIKVSQENVILWYIMSCHVMPHNIT